MKTLFLAMQNALEHGESLVLVTLIGAEGSVPRGVGSQMLVGRDGRIRGTVGGGPGEKQCEAIALELLTGRQSAVREFSLEFGGGTSAVCGGSVTALFQYVSGIVWAELASGLLKAMESHMNAWVVLSLDGSGPALLSDEGKNLAGIPVSEKGLTAGAWVRSEKYFSLKIEQGNRVFVFGAGHCAAALVPLLPALGFRPFVMDNRPEFASRERFPDAEQLIIGDFRRISDFISLNSGDYAVIMTSGHEYDFIVEEQLLRKPLAYVGVMGSKKKKAFVNEKLRLAGISEEAIQSVHTPIGIQISSETPQEIAVSIAGELILVRAQHREAASR